MHVTHTSISRFVVIALLSACWGCERGTPQAAVEKSVEPVRQGIAICIGASDLSSEFYVAPVGKPLPRLPGAQSDATAVADICNAERIKAKTFVGKNALVATARAEIERARTVLKKDDIFILYFSGHGTQRADGGDSDDDLDDRRDEVWCLYDGQIADDEIRELIAGFAAGVRVAVFSDSCHSGSMTEVVDAITEAIKADSKKQPDVRDSTVQRILLEADKKLLLRVSNSSPGDLPKELPPSVSYATQLTHKVRPANRRLAEADDGTRVQTMGACQDNQVAFESNGQGVYTAALRQVWNGGAFQGNYAAFHEAIRSLTAHKQTPRRLPSKSDFDDERPFSLDGKKGS